MLLVGNLRAKKEEEIPNSKNENCTLRFELKFFFFQVVSTLVSTRVRQVMVGYPISYTTLHLDSLGKIFHALP